MLELNDKGNVKNTIGNCLTVFQYDPVLSHAVRYNLLTERVDVGKPLWWVKNSPALTDTDICYFMYYLEKNYGLTSEKNIQNVADTTARAENPPALVKKIGRTTYIVRIHFSETSTETMSDKIKRMLKNEIQQMG